MYLTWLSEPADQDKVLGDREMILRFAFIFTITNKMLVMSLIITHINQAQCALMSTASFCYKEYFIFRMIKKWVDKYFELKKETIPLVLPKTSS